MSKTSPLSTVHLKIQAYRDHKVFNALNWINTRDGPRVLTHETHEPSKHVHLKQSLLFFIDVFASTALEKPLKQCLYFRFQ